MSQEGIGSKGTEREKIEKDKSPRAQTAQFH